MKKYRFPTKGWNGLLLILLLAAVILPLSAFLLYRGSHFPAPYYQAASYQALADACRLQEMIVPDIQTIPFEDQEYMIYLESRQRNSAPIEYHIQASTPIFEGYLSWSVRCTTIEDETPSLSGTGEYRGISIYQTYHPPQHINDRLSQEMTVSFLLGRYQYDVTSGIAGTDQDYKSELETLLTPALQSIIDQWSVS